MKMIFGILAFELLAHNVTAWRRPVEFDTLYTLNCQACAQADCCAKNNYVALDVVLLILLVITNSTTGIIKNAIPTNGKYPRNSRWNTFQIFRRVKSPPHKSKILATINSTS